MKEAKTDMVFSPSTDWSQEDVQTHAKFMWSSEVARHYAEKFNTAIEEFTEYRVELLKCYLYAVLRVEKKKGQTSPTGKFRTLFAGEDHIGSSYKKWLSNWDYICQDADAAVPGAFAHYTFHKTNGLLLVSDLQGSLQGKHMTRYILTDPQVLSHDGSWGPADTGRKGMMCLMEMHRCGPLCRHLGLDPASEPPARPLTSAGRRESTKGTKVGERLAVRDLFTGPKGPKRMLFVGECSLSFCRAAAQLVGHSQLPWMATDKRWPDVGRVAREWEANCAWLTSRGVSVEPSSIDASKLHQSFPWLQNSTFLEAVVWAMPYPDAYSPLCAHPDDAVQQEMVRLVRAYVSSALRILRPGGDAIVLLTSKQHLQWGLRVAVDVPQEGRYAPFVQVYNLKELTDSGYRPRFGDHRDDEDQEARYHLSSEVVAVQWRRGDLLTPSGISDSRIVRRGRT
eukprot:gnl/TRDRNA2_/TRDRNA2_140047_c1_seq1.p1 gnl/TRDRNA2_/TRDRNA2_140047_c1~~gnl/TRDRNA2_/TRDRNA2_140047_c1_seq1.p1  ORF type:complete len:528 (+),score=53.52 gnl/TRDRNA2_/TRDRNA2_140047_c1_seq1:231-1586(+)